MLARDRHLSAMARRFAPARWISPILGFVLSSTLQGGVQSAVNPKQAPNPHFSNTSAKVHYLGSKQCAGCHSTIYQQFSRTDMGRSMFEPEKLAALGWLTKPVDFFNEQNHRHYQVFSRGSKVYESEYELDAQGGEIFRHTEELEYVIGTGANGATPFVRRGNFLFQAPISYYRATQSWDLSPNYEVRDLAFNLPITSDCVGCHSGRIQPVRGRGNLYDDPALLEPAIGCESCHGPGELHVFERQTGAPVPTAIDATIVNPARLSPWLADNICMNCHEGDIRVFQEGKSFVDFRPGTPLNDTVFILKAPIDPRAPQTPLLEHYYSMTLSKCYRSGGGKLGCQSCHDPHLQPSPAEATEYFRGKCLQCHTDKSCTLALPKRLAQQPADDCAACHMPKRPALTVSHSSLTDHRILRTADESYPRSAFAESLPGTGFIHVNAIPGKADSVPPVALLKAYRQEIMRSNLEFKGHYFSLLERLSKFGSKDAFVLSALAQKAGSDGNLELAIRYARAVIDKGDPSDSDYLLLEGFLARSGELRASIDLLNEGLSLFPFSNALYEDLATRQLMAGDSSGRAETIQRGLQLFPEDSVLRNAKQQQAADDHLQKGVAQLKQGNMQAAMTEFQAAVRENPGSAPAHDYLGVVLGESQKLNEAIAEFEEAVRADPAFPDPHFHLGLAYLKTGKTDAAIVQYQEALRLNPKMVEAQYGLSEICGKLGDIDGAITLLRKVTRAEPDFAEAHYNLGLNLWNRYKKSTGLRQQSDLEEAAQELKKATELAPRQATALLALGQLLSDKGDLLPSAENLQKAVDLDPANPEYRYNLGLALRLKGDLEPAAAEFRAALKLAPQLALAHRSLGLVLRETGDLDGAAGELRQSVVELPDDAQGHHLLGTVLLKQDKVNGAIVELRKAVEIDPTLTDARASLAQALQKAGQKEDSQQQIAELRGINDEKAKAGQSMILVQTAAGDSRKGDFAAAVRILEEAVTLRPELIEAEYQLAVALRRSGNTKRAEAILRSILREHPNEALAHLDLGLLLAKQQNETQPATEELRQAIQLAPSLVEAHAALGKLARDAHDWSAATREFQAVLAWKPEDREIRAELASALKASGHAAEAAQEIELTKKPAPPSQ